MPGISVAEFDVYGRRGQEIVLVLFALRELGARHTKQEVLRFIRARRFYDVQPDDKASYAGRREWKADTLLCWGRKDAVIEEWMFHHDEKDSWELTREGLRALEDIIVRFRSGRWKIHKCFLWRSEFKKIVDSSYVQSSVDETRPHGRREQSQFEQASRLLAKLQRQHGIPPKA